MRFLYAQLLSLFFLTVVSGQSLANRREVEKTTMNVYGSVGINVSEPELHKIRLMLVNLRNATPCQLYEIAQLVRDHIEQELQHIEEKINQPEQQQKAIILHDFFKRFYYQTQRDHNAAYSKQLYKKFSFIEQVSCMVEKITYPVARFFKKESTISWVELVADQVIDYMQFEQDMLVNYNKLLIFFAAIKNNPLPGLINTWSTNTVQHAAGMRVRHLKPQIQMQQFEEIFAIALQSYIMAGGGMYTQWLDEEDQLEYQQLSDEQAQIQSGFELYLHEIKTAQQVVTKKILNGFQQGMKSIDADYKKANKEQQQEQVHLFKSINLDYPIVHALNLPPVPFDQIFAASIMSTPPRHRWYNIYQYGDWEFDAKHNSFWQNGLIAFGIPFWQATAKTDQSRISDPSQNSIFTEYISNAATYDIVIECTLINVQYPFFVGILFNRARWISADPERIWQYRLVGLYGTQFADNKRLINLCFAQQILANLNKQENIISPLQQITMSNKSLFTLPAIDAQTLLNDAITYRFEIKTSPTSVTITLKNNKGVQLYSNTLVNLDSYLAIFNGIGFMAAGCQAEFKIIKPERLVYTESECKEFLETHT